jgi:hypothetical protein
VSTPNTPPPHSEGTAASDADRELADYVRSIKEDLYFTKGYDAVAAFRAHSYAAGVEAGLRANNAWRDTVEDLHDQIDEMWAGLKPSSGAIQDKINAVYNEVARHTAEATARVEASVKELEGALKESSIRDGEWFDKWGSCRVCGGEIPDGHSNSCDYYKQQQRIDKLTAFVEEVSKEVGEYGRIGYNQPTTLAIKARAALSK